MRTRDVILAAVIALGFFVHELASDWDAIPSSLRVLLSILGIIVALGAILTLIYDNVVKQPIDEAAITEVPQPKLARFLFHDTRSAPIWLAVRLYVGIAWLTAGWEKMTGDPSWLTSGASLQKFWQSAVAIPQTGKPAITYDWYRNFIQYMLDHGWYDWFAKVICIGEFLIGLGLILGGLTGIAAFFGALMNMSFLLAGSDSTNPVMYTLAILLVLAWQVAGYWGADRFILPLLGAPWSPGLIAHRERLQESGETSPAT